MKAVPFTIINQITDTKCQIYEPLFAELVEDRISVGVGLQVHCGPEESHVISPPAALSTCPSESSPTRYPTLPADRAGRRRLFSRPASLRRARSSPGTIDTPPAALRESL